MIHAEGLLLPENVLAIDVMFIRQKENPHRFNAAVNIWLFSYLTVAQDRDPFRPELLTLCTQAFQLDAVSGWEKFRV